jgi:hypothetical protein
MDDQAAGTFLRIMKMSEQELRLALLLLPAETAGPACERAAELNRQGHPGARPGDGQGTR